MYVVPIVKTDTETCRTVAPHDRNCWSGEVFCKESFVSEIYLFIFFEGVSGVSTLLSIREGEGGIVIVIYIRVSAVSLYYPVLITLSL